MRWRLEQGNAMRDRPQQPSTRRMGRQNTPKETTQEVCEAPPGMNATGGSQQVDRPITRWDYHIIITGCVRIEADRTRSTG
jgi:hypothetical protein